MKTVKLIRLFNEWMEQAEHDFREFHVFAKEERIRIRMESYYLTLRRCAQRLKDVIDGK